MFGNIIKYAVGNKIKLMIGAAVVVVAIGVFFLGKHWIDKTTDTLVNTATDKGAAQATTKIVENTNKKLAENATKIDTARNDLENNRTVIQDTTKKAHAAVDDYIKSTPVITDQNVESVRADREKWANDQTNALFEGINADSKKVQ